MIPCTQVLDLVNRLQSPKDFDYFYKYLAQPSVRKAVHVGDLVFNSGEKVAHYLESDMMQSVKPWLAEMMNYYKVGPGKTNRRSVVLYHYSLQSAGWCEIKVSLANFCTVAATI